MWKRYRSQLRFGFEIGKFDIWEAFATSFNLGLELSEALQKVNKSDLLGQQLTFKGYLLVHNPRET